MGSVPPTTASEFEEATQVRLPKPGVPWQSLAFGGFPVNGHVVCTLRVSPGAGSGEWSEPRWEQDPLLRVHGLSPALNYAQQGFEGLRVFRAPSGRIQLFRVGCHAARFARTLAAVDIPAVPEGLFSRAVRLAVALNSEFVPPFDGGCSMYVRPLAFASSATMNLKPAEEYTFCVFVTPVGNLFSAKPPAPAGPPGTAVAAKSPAGLKALVVDDFDRTAPNGTGAFKIGGNYGPTIRVMNRARQKGYDLTLHLDSSTQSLVHEFSSSGFMGVRRDGVDATPAVVVPKDSNILPSITVKSALEIARSFGWNVEHREIPFAELVHFSEVYTVGTASSLIPVGVIAREATGDRFEFTVDPSSPASCYAQLSSMLDAVKRGLQPEPWGWVEELDRGCLKGDIDRMTGKEGVRNSHVLGNGLAA